MKFVKIMLTSFVIFILLSQSVLAVGDIFDKAKNWTDTGQSHTDVTMDTTKLKTASNTIYNLLLAAATGVAVIVGAILGIQYMMAGVDKKVEVKESLFPYLISCLVVFSSFGIWKLMVTLISNF